MQTPNLAYNANMGWEDAASLTNHLRCLLLRQPYPSAASLDATFAHYQQQRECLVAKYLAQSSQNLRDMAGTAQSGSGWLASMQARLTSSLGDARAFMDNEVSPLIAQGIKLDFVNLKERHRGRVPYEDELPQRPQPSVPQQPSPGAASQWLGFCWPCARSKGDGG